MRLVLVVAVAAAVFALPASAAEVDPKALVLRPADMPAGFKFDEPNSGYRSNANEADGDQTALALFRSWGRVTGYEAIFERRSARVESRVDLLRKRDGARRMFAWYDRALIGSGPPLLVKRDRASIGDEAWIYRMSSPLVGRFTLVVWRYDRVFAGIVSDGITRERSLALARAQQRRMAAALR